MTNMQKKYIIDYSKEDNFTLVGYIDKESEWEVYMDKNKKLIAVCDDGFRVWWKVEDNNGVFTRVL